MRYPIYIFTPLTYSELSSSLSVVLRTALDMIIDILVLCISTFHRKDSEVVQHILYSQADRRPSLSNAHE